MYISCPEDSIWQLSSSSSCSILYAPSSVMLTKHTGADIDVDGWALSSYLSHILWSVVNLSIDYCPRHGQALWPSLRVPLISAYQSLQPSSLMIFSPLKIIKYLPRQCSFSNPKNLYFLWHKLNILMYMKYKESKKDKRMMGVDRGFSGLTVSHLVERSPQASHPVRRIFQTSVSTRTSKPFPLSTSWPHV